MLKRFFLATVVIAAPVFASDEQKESRSQRIARLHEQRESYVNGFAKCSRRELAEVVFGLVLAVQRQQIEIDELKEGVLISRTMNSYLHRHNDYLYKQLENLTQKVEENRCQCHCNTNSSASSSISQIEPHVTVTAKESYEHPLVMLNEEQDNHNNQ
jgi:hypothetical protein